MSFHSTRASSADRGSSSARRASITKPTGRKPSKANLLLAHRECFDHLRWELRLSQTYPEPQLSIDGDERFEAYLQGLTNEAPLDRAITAVVQSMQDIVEGVAPASIRLHARGEAALYTPAGKKRMLRSVRLNIRKRMRKAVWDGFKGLQALREGRVSYRPRAFDWERDVRDDEVEMFEELWDHLHGSDADEEEPAPPSTKLVKQAVRFVCSPRVPFEIVIESRFPLTFAVKGGQTFKAYIAGKRLTSDAEVARTAVAEAIDRLVPQFDEDALRSFFPRSTLNTLTAAPMRNFILKKVREAVDAAVASGGYAALAKLKNWRGDLIEDEDAIGEVGLAEPDEPNEIDEMLADIDLPEDLPRWSILHS
jgi:hypothetical protein